MSEGLGASEVAGTLAKSGADTTAKGTATAAALASIATITAAMLASNVAIAAGAAAPAALVSLATAGANAVPATAGILSTVAVAEGVAATAFLADGGLVRGPGGPREDKIPAMLSNREFVVNAKSTAMFLPQLEAMNAGREITPREQLESRASEQQSARDTLSDREALMGGNSDPRGAEAHRAVGFADGGLVLGAKASERFKPQPEATNNGGGQEQFGGGGQGGGQDEADASPSGGGGSNVNVVNVLDPSIVEDFIDSSAGEQTIINVIERNATAIGQIVGGG